MSAQSYEDPERTRRIQEEIRRKIAERRSGKLPPPLPPAMSERPVAPPILAPRPTAGSGGGLRERLERKLTELREKAEATAAAQRNRELAERRVRDQAAAAEKAELARRVAAAASVRTAPAPRPLESPVVVSPALSRLRYDLRDPQSLRRAMVLREVLGPPVGLR